MKILMHSRRNLYSAPGGDTVQIEGTARSLRKLSVDVEISTGDALAEGDFDLLHFFNIVDPDQIIDHLAHWTKPFVVSTIFVEYDEYERKSRRGVSRWILSALSASQVEYLKTVAKWLLKEHRICSWRFLLHGYGGSIRIIAGKAALLLPNSHSEYRRLQRGYGIQTPYRKVPNALDPQIFDDSVSPNEEFRDFVVSVGRIEGLKNQLNLIRALKGTGRRLAIIGKPAPNQPGYYRRCRAEADGQTIFVEHLPQRELAAIFKAARVHALPSWFETTGLASLEAASMGCSIVATRKGDTEEYFGDWAHYCDPENPDSIRSAVEEAASHGAPEQLRRYIRDYYTWDVAAVETLKAYRAVLGEHDDPIR